MELFLDCGPSVDVCAEAELKESYRAASEGSHFVPGAGLPGRVVVKSKQPCGYRCVARGKLSSNQSGRGSGPEGPWGSHLYQSDEVLAVIEFFRA